MPKSKTRKNHKQKLKARNLKIKHAKKQVENQRQRILEQLINQEQEAGKFDENVNREDLKVDVSKDDVNIDVGPEI
jgi:anaerobic ribonucleoside-triphosphate reductase